MAFTPTPVDPNHIEAAPGPWQHWILNVSGVVRYLCAYNLSTGFSIYKSTDSGATFTAIDVGNYPGSIDSSAVLQTQLIVGGGSAGSDLIRTCAAGNRVSGIIELCEFDVGTLTWSVVTNIGGSFNQHTHDSLSATECASVERFYRRDGTSLIVYQCEPLVTGAGDVRSVRILILSGSTWTELARYASATNVGPAGSDWIQDHYILWTAILDGYDNLHIFMNHAHVPVPDGGSFYQDPLGMEMVHVSVAGANDAVSLVHSIEQDIEQMPAATNPAQPTASTENGRAAVNSNSTQIAFGYGYHTNTFPAGPGAEVHVATGNLTGDPLNPVWTVDVVATGEPVWSNGFSNDVSVTYENPAKIALEYFGSGVTTVAYGEHALAGLKVYWATEGGSSKGKLRFSCLSGIWSAAAQLWPDPDSSAVSLDGFDVPSEPLSALSPLPLTILCPIGGGVVNVGTFYSAQMIVSGGNPPYTFSMPDPAAAFLLWELGEWDVGAWG